MSKIVNLAYIGDVRSLTAKGKQIAFVTEHIESKPTSIYVIDGESNKLTSVALPCGGLSVCKLDDQFWVGGTDGKLYSATGKDKSATEVKAKLPSPATTIVSIDETSLACICGGHVLVLDAKGKTKLSLEFESEGEPVNPTCIGASADGI